MIVDKWISATEIYVFTILSDLLDLELLAIAGYTSRKYVSDTI